MSRLTRLTGGLIVALLFCCCQPRLMTGPVSPDYMRTEPPVKAPAIDCLARPKAECLRVETLIRRTTLSTVMIQVARYDQDEGLIWMSGTGEVIDGEGTVITAAHVVSKAVFIAASTRQLSQNGQAIEKTRTVPMSLFRQDTKLDVAMLTPLPGERPPPALKPHDLLPQPGQTVWGFGHSSSWAEGRVKQSQASLSYASQAPPITGLIKVEAVSRKGDSGGPLVDQQGRLIGLLVMHEPSKGLSYYRPIGPALKALGYGVPAVRVK